MLKLRAELGALAASALKVAFPGAAIPEVIAVDRSAKDDLQTAAALALAKAAGAPPRAIAEIVAAAWKDVPAVAGVTIAGPGFVNVRLRDEWLAAHARDGLELRDVGKGARVV